MTTQQTDFDKLREIATLDPCHVTSLAELDENDFLDSELQYIVQQTAGRYCEDICFVNDKTSDGKREFEYSVNWTRMTGFADRDEQGPFADTESAHDYIAVEVKPEMTFAQIALDVAKAVYELENNYYSRKG